MRRAVKRPRRNVRRARTGDFHVSRGGPHVAVDRGVVPCEEVTTGILRAAVTAAVLEMPHREPRKLDDQTAAGATSEIARVVVLVTEMEMRIVEARLNFLVNVNDRSAPAGWISGAQRATHIGLLLLEDRLTSLRRLMEFKPTPHTILSLPRYCSMSSGRREFPRFSRAGRTADMRLCWTLLATSVQFQPVGLHPHLASGIIHSLRLSRSLEDYSVFILASL
jgi:hypothetical protein